MPRIELIPSRAAEPELRRSYRRVSALWEFHGSRPGAAQIMQCFSHRPRLLEATGEGYRYAGWLGNLPRTTRELVAVLVSRENECFY